MDAVSIAFCAAFLLAVNVVLLKLCVDHSNPFSATFLVTAFGLVLFLGLSLWQLPLDLFQSKAFFIFAAAGIFMPFLGRWSLMLGLERVGPSLTASVTSTSPALATVLAAVWLDESISVGLAFGIGVIILGVSIISHSGHDRSRRIAVFTPTGLLFPILATVCAAMTFFLRKMGLNLIDSPLLGVTGSYVSSTLAYSLILSLCSSTRQNLVLPRKNWMLFLAAGMSLGAAWMLSYQALGLWGRPWGV